LILKKRKYLSKARNLDTSLKSKLKRYMKLKLSSKETSNLIKLS